MVYESSSYWEVSLVFKIESQYQYNVKDLTTIMKKQNDYLFYVNHRHYHTLRDFDLKSLDCPFSGRVIN